MCVIYMMKKQIKFIFMFMFILKLLKSLVRPTNQRYKDRMKKDNVLYMEEKLNQFKG